MGGSPRRVPQHEAKNQSSFFLWLGLLCVSVDYADNSAVLVSACGDFVCYRRMAGVAYLFYVGVLASVCKKNISLAVARVYDLDVYQWYSNCLAVHLDISV